MASEIKVDTIVNAGGDNDSGIDLGTNDTVKVTIAGAEKARFDSNGRLGIGTTSPDTQLVIANGSDTAKINLDSDSIDFFTQGKTFNLGTTGNTVIRFFQDNSEAVRIDDGARLLVGTTSTSYSETGCRISSGGGIQNTVSGGQLLRLNRTTSTGNMIQFWYNGGEKGTISTNGSNVAYNTSSDYRLKENVVTDWDATTRLKALKPSRFNWKADADTTVDGFLAHEVSSIVPEAVTGEKDAVDADGNPDYQGIDQSKLVPLLTKALQEAVAKIETLEAKVTALEST